LRKPLTAKILTGIGNMFHFRMYLFAAVLTTGIVACDRGKMANEDKKMVNASRENILQMIIDHNDVQTYLHPEVAGRVPLMIISNEDTSGLDVEFYGKPVKFVSKADVSEDAAVLEVDKLSINDGNAEFLLHYNIEGVEIKGAAIRKDAEWVLDDILVSEH